MKIFFLNIDAVPIKNNKDRHFTHQKIQTFLDIARKMNWKILHNDLCEENMISYWKPPYFTKGQKVPHVANRVRTF
jgi:hypothetical protein